MKTSKNFQKSKKPKSFDNEREVKIKKVNSSSKEKKYFKRDILEEIDDSEELDLFNFKDD